MTNFNMKNATIVSGRAIGRNSKKIVGCENCNFMQLYVSKKKSEETGLEFYKTGNVCPRCSTPVLRVFDSQAEFQRAQELKLMRDAGEIEDLEFQVKFMLHVPEFKSGDPVEIYSYVADFTYFETHASQNDIEDSNEDGRIFIVEDVKNKNMVITETAKMKIRHFEIEYGMPVRLVGR